MQTNFSPAQLADPETAAAEAVIRKCVHCGFCLATCPTYTLLGDELDSPRGRIYLMKDMLENGRRPTAQVVKHVDRCLSCLSCMTTCPSGVDYRRLVDHARAYIESHHSRSPADRLIRGLLAFVLPHPARFRLAAALGRLARPLAPLLRRSQALKPLAAMLTLAPAARAAAAPAQAASPPASGPRRGRVILLKGCVEPEIAPQIRAAAVRVLTRAGYDVSQVAGEGCCGALVHHMGREDDGLGFVRRNVAAWRPMVEAGEVAAIVVTASGCGSMVKDYGHLLRHDPALAGTAAKVSALARDITELLAEIPLPDIRPPAGAGGEPLTVAYQAPCSLQHGQQVRRQPRALLEAAGFRVREPAEAHLCCGSAGVYNILQPDISAQLRSRKVANLAALEPDVVATGNIGCLTQIAAEAKVPVAHVVELLDWAYGGPKPAGLP
ncbi:MAG: glycolate oxidase subunit GlcF [Caulobacteraceae bacterium]|nr:glycolate oxidase subunit GlcF [Caulobacteraceae bacterium]